MSQNCPPQIVLKLACQYHGFKWPESLTTGVMYYLNHRITVNQFNDWVKANRNV